jgi:hypothetical protein
MRQLRAREQQQQQLQHHPLHRQRAGLILQLEQSQRDRFRGGTVTLLLTLRWGGYEWEQEGQEGALLIDPE